jgi:hypothetical protein
MAEKKTTTTPATKLFEKQNLRLMLIGVVVIAVGMLLMVGGKSNNPAVFNEDDVYSFTRITVAPILIVAGLVIEIYAIFKKPKG